MSNDSNKASKVFKKAAKAIDKRDKDNRHYGCCFHIRNSMTEKDFYIFPNDALTKMFCNLYTQKNYHGYYWGFPTKRTVLVRQLALLFASEFYKDSGVLK